MYVEVDWRVGHTFAVQAYVEGAKGERFYCAANTWYLEKFNAPTRETKAANTFYYKPQYSLSVMSPSGDAAKSSGWYGKGSSVTLSTPKTADISQGIRDVFDSWNIGGSSTRDSTVNVVIESSTQAKAEYHKEYYLQVKSDFGNPSGSGWYKEGTAVSIRIERELPLPGLMGVLGGRRIFEGWVGSVTSINNVADVIVDSPKTVSGNWREDYSTPHAITAVIAIALVVILTIVYRRGVAVTRERAREGESPVDIIKRRYVKGEITREEFVKMKKDLEKRE